MSERMFVASATPKPHDVPPLCPQGHGPMKLVGIYQDDRLLGNAWFCVRNDREDGEYCGEAFDYYEQMEMFPNAK